MLSFCFFTNGTLPTSNEETLSLLFMPEYNIQDFDIEITEKILPLIGKIDSYQKAQSSEDREDMINLISSDELKTLSELLKKIPNKKMSDLAISLEFDINLVLYEAQSP